MRVSRIRTLGQQVGITYSDGYTVLRTSGNDDVYNNSDDILTRYSFDNEGRTVSIYSTDIYGKNIYDASNGEYETGNENAKNSIKTSAVVGGTSANYLLNGGFELNGAGSLSYWSTSGTVSTSSLIPYNSKFNANLTISSGTTSKIEQYAFLPQGEYTLSMNINTFDSNDLTIVMTATSLSNGSNAYTEEISYNEYYASGQYAYVSMNFNAGSYINGGEKFKITIQVTGGTSTAANTVIYVDNVMLEKNIGSSTYSMVNYGSFDDTAINSSGTQIYTTSSFWTFGAGTSYSVNDVGLPFGKTLSITGLLNNNSTAYQTIYKATADDYSAWQSSEPYDDSEKVFSISGFAKGTQQTDNASSAFRLRVEVQYYKGEYEDPYIKTETFDFNNSQNDWQFVSGTFVTNPSSNYDPAGEYGLVEEIRVYCDYFNNPGTAYFDNISVSRADEQASFYTYYDSGFTASYKSGWYSEWYYYENNNTEPELISRITSDKSWIDYDYDAHHNLETETFYKYTGLYSPVTETIINGSLLPQIETTYTYNSYGLLTNTSTRTVQFSGSSLVDTSPVNYITSSSTYNLTTGSRIFGSLATEIDSLGKVTRYFYDTDKGYLLAVINQDQSTGLVYSYDSLGNIVLVQPATYNGSTYTAVSSSAYADYDYDTCNRLSTITTDSTVYTVTYDTFGATDTIYAGSHELISYTYNSNNGKLDTLEYGNGLNVRYVYDELDRISEIWYTNSYGTYVKRYEYSYDSNGNLYKFNDLYSGKTYIYKYDDQNRLTNYIEYDAATMVNQSSSYITYDEQSRTDMVFYDRDYTYSTSNIDDLSYYYNYSYNNAGSISGLNIHFTSTDYTDISLTYDALQRATAKTVSMRYGSNTVSASHEYTYTSSGTNRSLQVSSLTSKINSATVNLYNYTYDNNGNITQITNSGGVTQYKYTYDDLGQLVREDNNVKGYSYTYTYDDAGNILAKRRYAYTTGALGTVLQTTSYTYGDATWGDLLTSFGGASITYDSIGNPVTYGGDTLDWEGRRLTQYTCGSGEEEETYTYTYNDDGIRTSKDVNGTLHKYTLSGSTILTEEFLTYLFVYLYDEAGEPIGLQYRKTTDAADVFNCYLFEKNLQGDIVGIYNTSGTKLATYTYDAWGAMTVTMMAGITTTDRIAASLNPFRYRGYYFDTETGFYSLQSRYYDPEIGRFINADDTDILGVEQGSLLQYNLFAYCLNNPVNRTDDSGYLSMPNWLKVTVGAVATVAAVAVTVATGGAAAPILIGVATSTLSGAAIGYVTGGTQGMIDGASDGFMWGGIGALASSAVSAVKAVKTAKQGIAIGEKMERVRKAAEVVDGTTYKAMKGYKTISKISPKLADKLSLAHNKAFITRMTKLGAAIYDTGPAGSNIVSKWYSMERQVVKGYFNYVKMF